MSGPSRSVPRSVPHSAHPGSGSTRGPMSRAVSRAVQKLPCVPTARQKAYRDLSKRTKEVVEKEVVENPSNIRIAQLVVPGFVPGYQKSLQLLNWFRMCPVSVDMNDAKDGMQIRDEAHTLLLYALNPRPYYSSDSSDPRFKTVCNTHYHPALLRPFRPRTQSGT